MGEMDEEGEQIVDFAVALMWLLTTLYLKIATVEHTSVERDRHRFSDL